MFKSACVHICCLLGDCAKHGVHLVCSKNGVKLGINRTCYLLFFFQIKNICQI